MSGICGGGGALNEWMKIDGFKKYDFRARDGGKAWSSSTHQEGSEWYQGQPDLHSKFQPSQGVGGSWWDPKQKKTVVLNLGTK